MTREEEINQAKQNYIVNTPISDWFSASGESFRNGVLWADQHPRKGLVDIDKIASFIKYHAQEFVYISIHSGEAKIDEFKFVEAMYKVMEE